MKIDNSEIIVKSALCGKSSTLLSIATCLLSFLLCIGAIWGAVYLHINNSVAGIKDWMLIVIGGLISLFLFIISVYLYVIQSGEVIITKASITRRKKSLFTLNKCNKTYFFDDVVYAKLSSFSEKGGMDGMMDSMRSGSTVDQNYQWSADGCSGLILALVLKNNQIVRFKSSVLSEELIKEYCHIYEQILAKNQWSHIG